MKVDNLVQSMKQKMSNRNVYFCWSGGDDSNLLLRIILNACINNLCNFTIITILFPQHAYSEEKLNNSIDFFKKQNINIQILKTEAKIDNSVLYTDVCPICKSIRRTRFLEYYMSIHKEGDLILTGHNLSDLMSYYIELCIFQLNFKSSTTIENRFLEVNNKFLQSYQAEDNIENFRPMLNLSHLEIQELLLSGPLSTSLPLEIMSQKCYWINQRKRLLQDYFVKSNVSSDFSSVKKLLINNFRMPSLEEFKKLPFDTYLM